MTARPEKLTLVTDAQDDDYFSDKFSGEFNSDSDFPEELDTDSFLSNVSANEDLWDVLGIADEWDDLQSEGFFIP